MRFQRIITASFILCSFVSVSACSGDSAGDPFNGTGGMFGTGGTGAGVGTGGTGAGVGTGGTGAGVGTGGTNGECSIINCGKSSVMDCGDCIDNDGDGLMDNDDPECLGPCDNTEGPVLEAGVPGHDANSCGADCYFDSGAGSGSGECKWDRSCDPLEPKVDPSGANPQCIYDAGLIGTTSCPVPQPPSCEDDCGPLTPNGCDCFGCCTFPVLAGRGTDDGPGYIFLGSEIKGEGGTCTIAELTLPERCFPCTPVDSCLNTCEKCELCLGKTELEPECFPGSGGSSGTGGSGTGGMGGSPGGERCPDGKQACGLPGDAPCESGGFCLTGCCIIVQ
jgi:hypothetical protein